MRPAEAVHQSFPKIVRAITRISVLAPRLLMREVCDIVVPPVPPDGFEPPAVTLGPCRSVH